MGIIFSDKQKRVQIKDLLKQAQGKIILSRLQAGRMINEYGCNVPYRLSDAELELLKDEWIYIEANDCWFARFEKPVNEIRKLLGLPEQSMNPFMI